MQEGWQAFHNEKNGNCEYSKKAKDNSEKEEAPEASGRKANAHHHGPQHLWQLCAREKESKPWFHCWDKLRSTSLRVWKQIYLRNRYALMRGCLTCMSQTEGPKPQIGSGVGNTTQAVLYGVNCLVHGHVRKVKLWENVTACQHHTVKDYIPTTGPEANKGQLRFTVCMIIQVTDRKAISPQIKGSIVILGPWEPTESAALLMFHAHHRDRSEAPFLLTPTAWRVPAPLFQQETPGTHQPHTLTNTIIPTHRHS